MLVSATLQNFKAFGVATKVEFEPITVLVGPNNSGKSSLFHALEFLGEVARGVDYREVAQRHGGLAALWHQPPQSTKTMNLSWDAQLGSYQQWLSLEDGTMKPAAEQLWFNGQQQIQEVLTDRRLGGVVLDRGAPFGALYALARQPSPAAAVTAPLRGTRCARVSVPSLRRAAPPTALAPALTDTGEGLAQVLSHWRNLYPEKAAELDEFIGAVLPEIEHVLAAPAPSPQPGALQLVVRQKDGVRVEAAALSDGVLCFIALAMHAIDAEEGGVLLIEEPEQAIHPTRIHQLVDLLRSIVRERRCQIVLSTHSTVVLSEFRDEPERIRVFRRSPHGAQVRNLNTLKGLEDALHRQDPGEMLAHGFFEARFDEMMG